MDWTKITDNQRVISLLKKRQRIEKEIKEIDENALIMYELEVLSIPDVVGQSEQLCDCAMPDPIDPFDEVDKETCRKCGNKFA